MTNPDSTSAQPQPPEFKNRKKGLTAFGVILIFMGALTVLFFLISLLSVLITRSGLTQEQQPPMLQFMVGISFYLVISVTFIWLGVGSTQAKRWARALILIGSWYTLLTGITALIFMFAIMPGLSKMLGEGSQANPQVLTIVQTFMYSLIIIFFLILPIIFIWFYSNKNVKATCEHLDPRERWTDRCPLPVLAISILFFMGVISLLMSILYGSVVPFFGFYLSGLPGFIGVLVLIGVLIFLTFRTYALDARAWWGALGLTVVGSLSAIITFYARGIMGMYEKMNFPPQQLALMQEMNLMPDSLFIAFTGIGALLFIGYLLFIRKYFIMPAPPVGQ